MKVFKIENKLGCGPYSSDESASQWMDHPHLDSDHPNLTEESLLDLKSWVEQNKGYSFEDFTSGFSTLDQLERWFSPKELIRLKEKGFDVVEKEALIVFELSKQVAFIPKESDLIIKK